MEPATTDLTVWIPVISAVGAAITAGIIAIQNNRNNASNQKKVDEIKTEVVARIGGVQEQLSVVAGNVDGKLEKLMILREAAAEAKGILGEKERQAVETAAVQAAVARQTPPLPQAISVTGDNMKVDTANIEADVANLNTKKEGDTTA